MSKVELDIGGMTCASCAAHVEKGLNKVEGVTATVNFATERATAEVAPGVTPAELVAAVEGVGYSAVVADDDLPRDALDDEDGDAVDDDETRSLRHRLAVSAVLSAPVVALAMIPRLQFDNWQWLSFALAAPVVVWGGWPFHRAAWASLRHGATTMDTLISMGTLAAFGWSVYALFFGDAGEASMRMPFDLTIERTEGAQEIYFEVAAGVTVLILLGRYLEARAKRRSSAALRALLALGAKDVALLRDG